MELNFDGLALEVQPLEGHSYLHDAIRYMSARWQRRGLRVAYKVLRKIENSRHPRIDLGYLFRSGHFMINVLLCFSDDRACDVLQNANERCDPVSALQAPV